MIRVFCDPGPSARVFIFRQACRPQLRRWDRAGDGTVDPLSGPASIHHAESARRTLKGPADFGPRLKIDRGFNAVAAAWDAVKLQPPAVTLWRDAGQQRRRRIGDEQSIFRRADVVGGALWDGRA